jgi:hypothetical protein
MNAHDRNGGSGFAITLTRLTGWSFVDLRTLN